MSLRCKLKFHAFTETDEFNRTTCERCGTRLPKAIRVLSPEELEGRQLIRRKTKGAPKWK